MTVAVFIPAVPSFFFVSLFLHDLYDPNDKLVQPKFGKTAIVLIEQSISVLPLSILLHPIRVMRHTGWVSPAAAWIVQAAALLSTLLTSSPAFLHRKEKLWMTCKSRGLSATCLHNGMGTWVHQWGGWVARGVAIAEKCRYWGKSAGTGLLPKQMEDNSISCDSIKTPSWMRGH